LTNAPDTCATPYCSNSLDDGYCHDAGAKAWICWPCAENTPDEEDLVIGHRNEIYSYGHASYGYYPDPDKEVVAIMQRENFYPTVWREDDHGGYTMIHL
jgi:hypothetical protein